MNSLIAEKLASLEFEKLNSEFQSKDAEEYFRGRREQAMRQTMYFEEYFEKVSISPEIVQSNLKMASRKVDLQFLNLPDTNVARKVQELDKKGSHLIQFIVLFGVGMHPIKKLVGSIVSRSMYTKRFLPPM